MKNNRSYSYLLAAVLAVVPWRTIVAQEAAISTNEEPALKDLMATNSIVTNTVGIILVKISPGFWVAKFDTTQKAYEKVMQGNPGAFKGADHPVDSVSWNDAIDFCRKLTARETGQLPDDYRYNLPTQSQWESLVANASLKDAVMKLNDSSINSTAPVGSLGPNSLGLYDMRGNVWAWCLDSHDPAVRVLRGGAWDTITEPSSRIECRNYFSVANDKPKNDYGFRVVLTGPAN